MNFFKKLFGSSDTERFRKQRENRSEHQPNVFFTRGCAEIKTHHPVIVYMLFYNNNEAKGHPIYIPLDKDTPEYSRFQMWLKKPTSTKFNDYPVVAEIKDGVPHLTFMALGTEKQVLWSVNLVLTAQDVDNLISTMDNAYAVFQARYEKEHPHERTDN
jgi:hypothetical protein